MKSLNTRVIQNHQKQSPRVKTDDVARERPEMIEEMKIATWKRVFVELLRGVMFLQI